YWCRGASALHGGHLYLAHLASGDEPAGIAIFDVRDPARPVRLADVQVGAFLELLDVADGRLYAIGPPPSTAIPTTRGVLPAPGPLTSLRARLRRQWPAPLPDGRYLSVYDLAKPALPRLR